MDLLVFIEVTSLLETNKTNNIRQQGNVTTISTSSLCLIPLKCNKCNANVGIARAGNSRQTVGVARGGNIEIFPSKRFIDGADDKITASQ